VTFPVLVKGGNFRGIKIVPDTHRTCFDARSPSAFLNLKRTQSVFVSGCCMTRLVKAAWFLHSNAFCGGFQMSAALSSTDLTKFILIAYVLHGEHVRVLSLSTTVIPRLTSDPANEFFG